MHASTGVMGSTNGKGSTSKDIHKLLMLRLLVIHVYIIIHIILCYLVID